MAEQHDSQDPSTDRTMVVIAEEIRREHAAAEGAYSTFIEHATRAGSLLIEAKALVRHGEWLPWLAENFPASRSTAANYMRLARKCAAVAHLPTMREALAAIAGPEIIRPVAEPSPPRDSFSEERFVAGVAEVPLHDTEADWSRRRSALVRKAMGQLVGAVAEGAIGLAEPHEQERMKREAAALLHEAQVYADRLTAEPWSLANGTDAEVTVVGMKYPGEPPRPHVLRPDEIAPKKWGAAA